MAEKSTMKQLNKTLGFMDLMSIAVGQIIVIKTLVPMMKKRNMLYEAYSFEKKSINSPDVRLSQSHG